MHNELYTSEMKWGLWIFFFNRKEGRKDKEKGNREREGGMEGGKQKG